MDAQEFNEYLNRLEKSLSFLPDKPEETASSTLKALWLMAADQPVSVQAVELYELPSLSDAQKTLLDSLIHKRIDGMPLAHITGKQSFMGIEMFAGPEALIPRKETEILAQTAIDLLHQFDDEEKYVIDVCTGAGNIALAIANSKPGIKVFAADISEPAIKLAVKNANHLNLSSQISFFCGDLLDPFNDLDLIGKVSLLTCNPPYISSSKVANMPDEISSHEPDLAFDGGAFGINLIRRLIIDSEKFLADKGYLVFEVGLGQGTVVQKQVQKSGLYTNIDTVNDASGNPRVIVAQKA